MKKGRIKEMIVCKCCGKTFCKELWRKAIFCSTKCRDESKKGVKSPEISIRMKGNKHRVGCKLSKETRKKIGDANRGKRSHLWKGGISDYKRKLHLNSRRRAKKLNAEGSHTQAEWEDLKKEYNYMCLCCKEYEPAITLTEDHILPLFKGGSDYIENIQPLCRSCNSKKHITNINYKQNFEKRNQKKRA